MQVHEQIYTSAKTLLGAGQSDLGLIAESVGFPSRLTTELAPLASYRIMESLPADDPSLHPPRFVIGNRGGNGEYFCISRIVFAGADHSGRTTPLAHHVFVDEASLREQKKDASDMVRSLAGFFSDRWQEEPKRFDPPREVPIQSDAKDPMPSSAWEQIPGGFRPAKLLGLVAQRFTSKRTDYAPPVVMVLPIELGDHVLGLIADLYRVLPAAYQQALSVQTHVVNSSDISSSPDIIFTYPGTPYLDEVASRTGKRKPVIFDVVSGEIPNVENVDYGKWIEQQVAASSSPASMEFGIAIRGRLGNFADESQTVFLRTIQLFQALRKTENLGQSVKLGQAIEGIAGSNPDAARYLSELTDNAIERYFKERGTDCNWSWLEAIRGNVKWPESSRQLVQSKMFQSPLQSWRAHFDQLDFSKWADQFSVWIRPLEQASSELSSQFKGSVQAEVERKLQTDEATWQTAAPLVQALVQSSDVSTHPSLAGTILESAARGPSGLNKVVPWIEKTFTVGTSFLAEYPLENHSPQVVEAIEAFRRPPEPPRPPEPLRSPAPVTNDPTSTRQPGMPPTLNSNTTARAGGVKFQGPTQSKSARSQSRSAKSFGDPRLWTWVAIGIASLVVLGIGVASSVWRPGTPVVKIVEMVGPALLAVLVAIAAWLWLRMDKKVSRLKFRIGANWAAIGLVGIASCWAILSCVSFFRS